MITVSICENNDQGNVTGKADRIDFSLESGEIILELESLYWDDPPKCYTNDRIIEIHSIRVKHDGRREWSGNIYWNAYQVPDHYALGLINVLLRSLQWRFNEGWGQIHLKIQTGEMITGRDLDLETDVQPLVVNPNQYEIPFK